MNIVKFDENTTSILDRDFFVDQEKQREEIKLIRQGKPIPFLPHDCKVHNLNTKSPELTMIGITPSGTKASVRVTNCEFYIDVMHIGMTKKSKKSPLSGYLDDHDRPGARKIDSQKRKECLENIKGAKIFSDSCYSTYRNLDGAIKIYPICAKIYNVGYLRHPEIFGYRICFKTSKTRESALPTLYKNDLFYVCSNCSSSGIIDTIFTKADIYAGYWIDISCYKCHTDEREERFRYTSTYKQMLDEKDGLTKARFCFRTDFKNLTKTEDRIGKDGIQELGDNNLICGMDIETCLDANAKEMEEVGKAIVDPHNKIFNSCMVFTMGAKWKSVNMFYTKDGKYHPECSVENCINVVCKSEKDLLLAKTLIWERTQPDFMVTYNGSGFDIPMILLKARIHNIFDEMFCRISCVYEDSYDERYVEINGYRYHHGNEYNGTVYSNWNGICTSSNVSGINASNQVDGLTLKGQKSEKKFKVENGTDKFYSLWSPFGCMMIDLFLYCCKTFVKEHDHSMNAFLKKKKIPQKLDMDYAEIWRHWKGNNFSGLKDVHTYCEYDARATVLLLNSLLYMPSMRKMCELTSLPASVIIYRADGIKAATLTYKYSTHKNMLCIENLLQRKPYAEYPHLFDHVLKEKLSNRGALVIVHKRGKISLWYKVKPEILDKVGKDFIISRGFETKLENGFLWVCVIMPIEAKDFSSLYPSVETVYNLSTDTGTFDEDEIERDEFMEHSHDEMPEFYKNIGEKYYTKIHNGDRSKFGVIPLLLQDMKDERNDLKAKMGSLKKERLDLERSQPPGTDFKSITRWNTLTSTINTLDGQQLAIKIAMNTVYGSTSYCKSTIYNYLIAFYTTYYGREFLKMQNEYLIKHGWTLAYNDTDSTYGHHPVEIYEYIIDRYLLGEIEESDYDRKMVMKSMKSSFTKAQILKHYKTKTRSFMEKELVYATGKKKIDLEKKLSILTEERNNELLEKIRTISDPKYHTFTDKLNMHFEEQCGSKYMKTIREETLYPMVVCQLKRYFGMAHENSYVEDGGLGDVLFRGFSLRKRDASKFLNGFVSDVVMKVIKTKKTNIAEITLNKLEYYFDELEKNDKLLGEYEFFQQTKRYKPTVKQNDSYGVVRSTLHLGRITQNKELKKVCKEPDPLEYVSYVKVQPTSYRRLNLNKYSSSKRECYLFTEAAKLYDGDLDWIGIIETLYSTCATLIAYLAKFDYTKEEYEFADKNGALEQFAKDSAKESTKKSRKYLETHYKELIQRIDPVYKKSKMMEAFSNTLKKSQPNLYINWMRNFYKGNALYILEILLNFDQSPSVAFMNLAETSKISTPKILQNINELGIEELTNKKEKRANRLESQAEFLESVVRILTDTLNNVMMANLNKNISMKDLGSPLTFEQLVQLETYHRELTIYAHQNRLLKVISEKNNSIEGIQLEAL